MSRAWKEIIDKLVAKMPHINIIGHDKALSYSVDGRGDYVMDIQTILKIIS